MSPKPQTLNREPGMMGPHGYPQSGNTSTQKWGRCLVHHPQTFSSKDVDPTFNSTSTTDTSAARRSVFSSQRRGWRWQIRRLSQVIPHLPCLVLCGPCPFHQSRSLTLFPLFVSTSEWRPLSARSKRCCDSLPGTLRVDDPDDQQTHHFSKK